MRDLVRESDISIKIDPLRELLGNYNTVTDGYRKRSGKKLLGVSCEFFPFEIIHSFGIQPLALPFGYSLKCCSGGGEYPGMYDALVYPDRCGCKDKPEIHTSGDKIPSQYLFKVFSGYGKEASIVLHESLEKMLKVLFGLEIRDMNIKSLAESVALYNELRSLVRGILELRKNNPAVLSNSELAVVFDAAFSLPPEIVREYLVNIFKSIKEKGEDIDGFRPKVMAYLSMDDTGELLDRIEDAGCHVYEDDSCRGRRRFDLSYNASSEYLYYEILDSFSYRPLCPSLRDVNERFELLYKMIKKHQVDIVLFIKDGSCAAREKQIRELRVMMMRSCVDALTVTGENCLDAVKDYMANI